MKRLWLTSLAMGALLAGVGVPAAAAGPVPIGAAGPAARSQPATFVAVQDNAIVVVSTSTGQVVRRLTRPPTDGSWIGVDPYLTGDGLVLYTHSTPYCSGNGIEAVSVRGGPVRVLVSGDLMFDAPRLSPDGRLLAYQSLDCGAGDGKFNVRVLRTGATHQITVPDGGIIHYDFSADSREIVAAVLTIVDGQYRWSVRAIPVTGSTAGRVLSGALAPESIPGFIARAGRSSTFAVDQYTPATGEEVIVAVDARTGQQTGTIAPVPSDIPNLAGLDYDRSGQHLLVQWPGGTVHTVSGGVMTQLATGFSGATW